MQDRLQAQLGLAVGKHQLAHLLSVERAVSVDQLTTERVGEGFDRSATGQRQRLGNGVCIDQNGATFDQQACHRTFAAADAAGQADRARRC